MARRIPVYSLLLCLCACRSAPPPSPGIPEPTRPAVTADRALACQHSEKVEAETPYVAALSPNESPFDAKDACVVSVGGIAATGDAMVAASGARPALLLRRWDHKAPPVNLALIQRRLGLSAAENARLLRDGLVVPERLGDSDYVLLLHEIFQSQLPLYFSADAVLHAIYASNDKLLAQIEGTILAPRLGALLEALHCALPATAQGLPKDVARDVDLYLTVARSLLADKAVASIYGQDAEAAAVFAKAKTAGELAEYSLFGRRRMIDFSLYRPRGHYATEVKDHNPGHYDLSAYFRAATWLSRLEFNIVSRSCRSSEHGPDRSPTPREAAVAVALGRLAASASRVEEIAAMDRAWELLSGKREDVPLPKLAELAATAGISALDDPKLAEKLRDAIGSSYARTARTHYTWEGCTELPVIATMLGPRIVADAAATRPLVHSETKQRRMLHAADMAFALGQDRALAYLQEDLKKYPQLRGNLDKARRLAQTLPGQDLYSVWSRAIHTLSERPTATMILPSFMQTEAFADLRVNTAVAAFGQLRHNYVLMAAQTYDEGGCAIPDAFIEPVPAFYDALVAYAERGAAVLRVLDPKDTSEAGRYFARLARTLRVLAKIARDEVNNRALTDEQKRFLAMVVEVTGSGRTTGGSPTFTGWYFDLFRENRDAFGGASFIADYYTSTELEEVAYAGVSGVGLGVFVVDTAGAPRVMVGPVARAYEHTASLTQRLTDADAAKLGAGQRLAPWASSYTVAAPPAPPLTFLAEVKGEADEKKSQQVTITAFSTRALGPVTIELLDHHRMPLAKVTHPVGVAKTRFDFPVRPLPGGSEYFGYEGVHIQVGEFDVWEIGGRADAQAGAPRLHMVTGDGHAYGGMPAVTPPPPPPRDQ